MTTPTERAIADAYSAIEDLIEEARDNLIELNDIPPTEEYLTAYRLELISLLRILDNLDDE